MDMPRRAVVTALMKQEHGGYANLVLANALKAFPEDGQGRDRGFISAVFYGTVQRQITLDYILQKFLSKPLHKMDAEVRAILRSGLYQALYLERVPVSAAINEAVTLTRKLGKTSAAGMVNAVLRKASAFDLSAENFTSEAQRLCVLYSVSAEICALLKASLGADCEAFLSATLEAPQLCVRVNTLQTSVAEVLDTFARQGIEAAAGEVANSLLVKYHGDITATKLFRHGLLHVQGQASQMACSALAVKAGETVLDLCAAPGGKSITLAQAMENKGELYCGDASENRLPLIESALNRMDITCAQMMHNDAAIFNEKLPIAHGVLCDVPCSGLGVLAKKPDIRGNRLEGLAALIALQGRILETGSRYVKSGGRLVYSTCTVNEAENEGVVQAFLNKHKDFSCVLPKEILSGARIAHNMITCLPQETNSDGFFVALLQRK